MHKTHPQITISYNLAKQYLADEADPVGSSIFEHSIRVFSALYKFINKKNQLEQNQLDILSAALLHDALEDSKCGSELIVKNTNPKVLKLVKQLTISFDNVSIKKAVHKYMRISFDAYLIKLADMVDNTQKTQYFIKINGPKWYKEFYYPLLNEYRRFNAHQIKKMKNKNYKYLKQAIFLKDNFDVAYKSLIKSVSIWENLHLD